MKIKKKYSLPAYILILTLLVSCGSNAGTKTNPDDETASDSAGVTDSSADTRDSNTDTAIVLSGEIDIPDAPVSLTYKGDYDTEIVLADKIEITGNGAEADGNVVTITAPGTYLISGTISDGQIVVNASGNEKVKLILNGVSISCSSGPAIYIISSPDKCILGLPEGAVSIVSDGETYTYFEDSGDEPNAAIFSNDDLKISGKGSLYVTGNYMRGISSKDDLTIEETSVYIQADDDGIRGKDSVEIIDAYAVIYAEADGIRTNNTEEEGKGYVLLQNSHMEITAALDGIQALTDITIESGEISIISGGGSVNSSSSTDSTWGKWGQNQKGGEPDEQAETQEDETASAKAMKANGSITISGGTFSIDSSDDCIHANVDVIVNGGMFTLRSGDDGIHADSTLAVNNGDITINQSYEGLEASANNIAGGTVNITASDDGLNAAGGNDNSALNRPGANSFDAVTDDSITISGGEIVVNADGDGVDSNGSINMTGGSCVVYGPTNEGNGALDYAGTFTMDGGTMTAFGSTGMAQGSSDGSKLAKIFVSFSGEAGKVVTVKDSSGKTICEETPEKTYGCIFISTPDITERDTYTIYADGTELGTTQAS